MRALYPGSFDPVTRGHEAVLRRAALLFDEVVVCVMVNAAKTGRLSVPERLERLCAVVADLDNVVVEAGTGGLLVDYCRQAAIDVVIRGVRDGRDLEHELPMAHMNRELAGVETLFLGAEPEQAYVSSTLVTAVSGQSLTTKPM